MAIAEVVGGVAVHAFGRVSVFDQRAEKDDEDDLQQEVKLGEALVLPGLLDGRVALLVPFLRHLRHRHHFCSICSRLKLDEFDVFTSFLSHKLGSE